MIVRECEKIKIVCEKQFGWKFKHAINLLVSTVNGKLNKEYCTDGCFIDRRSYFI